MPEIEGGAVFWARQTVESDIFSRKPHVWFKIWFYIVSKANWQDSGQDSNGLARGQCFLKYAWIEENTGAKKSEVDHCMRWLRNCRMLATRKATRGMIVTVRNYDKFQDVKSYKSDTKSDSKAIQKRFKSDRILKKEKKEKNTKETYLVEFNLFWGSYPRKVQKQKAIEAWQKCNGDRPEIQELLKIIEKNKPTKDWEKDDGRFIPYPATWLNGKRWEDELSPIIEDECPYH